MDIIVSITTILANIVTIGGIFYALNIFLKNYVKYKLVFDDKLNLKTKNKNIKKIIKEIFEDPETINKIDIILGIKKIKDRNNLGLTVLNKDLENIIIQRKVFIKRSIILMINGLLYKEILGWSQIILLDEYFIEYFKYIKEKNSNYNFIVNIEYKNIISKINISNESINKIKDFYGIKHNEMINSKQKFNDIKNIIDNIDWSIKKNIIFDLVKQLSNTEELWEDVKFNDKKELTRIFDSNNWDIKIL